MNRNDAQRYRPDSAALPGAGLRNEEIKTLINILKEAQGKNLDGLRTCVVERLVLQQLRHALIDQASRNETCDTFQRANGFQALLTLFHALAECLQHPEISCDDVRTSFGLLKDALAVLRAALQGSSGNQKYFINEIDGGGWQALWKSLEPLQHWLCRDQTTAYDFGRYLGILLATALDEETLCDVFTALVKEFQDCNLQDGTSVQDFMTSTGRATLSRCLDSVDRIPIPDIFPQMLHCCSTYPSAESAEGQMLATVLAEAILQVIGTRQRNLVAMHTVGLSQSLLPFIFDWRRSEAERSSYQRLALSLFQGGVGSLEVAYAIYHQAAQSSEAAQFLLRALQASRNPASIYFDLSDRGYCSVELATLGQPFPPTASSGYTLSLWAFFEEFDSKIHTTIFGAFDTSQKCFVLVYLEKDTRYLILQTAIKGSRPSVRFKSVSFQPGQWYHICLVHRRPRTVTSSKASLFVDGEFCEQLKTAYPCAPPESSTHRVPRVQAFFGTPQDLAVETKESNVSSKWLLASSVLFADTFSDDLISVFYHLGPRYYGNFQDCLGSFQTYAASAALNVRHENLHPGADEASDILSAVRQRASTLIAESSILINIAPTAVLDSEDRNHVDESQLVKSLSKLATKNLRQYTHSGGNAIVINAAVPAVDEALTRGHGVAILTGDPVVAVPQSLDDATWRVGGCAAVVLHLVYAAKTTQDLALAVELVFESVCQSWRNSEAMERDQGYAILATLLRHKLGLGSPGPSSSSPKMPVAIPTPKMDRNQLLTSLLSLVLQFVGYNSSKPERSMINNPLAYRVLLVDTDIWRQGEKQAQELYYKQFVTFAMESQNHRFNSRRLAHMRALKKLLDALKSEPMMSDIMPLFQDAFRSLLPGALSAEMLRSIALFITFSVHQKRQSSAVQPRRTRHTDACPRRSTQSARSGLSSAGLSRFQVGIDVLRLYSDFLCNKDDASVVKKFARTVTNKWLLYLLSESSPEVVILSAKILAKVLAVHGSSYVKKFEQKSGGFVIMRHRLKRWWHLPALWPICFGILFDIDVSMLNLDRPFDLFGLIDLFGSNNFTVVNQAMFEVMVGMLQSGLKAITTSRTTVDASAPDSSSVRSTITNGHRMSMSSMTSPDPFVALVADHHVETLHVVIRFLYDVHTRSHQFRDFSVNSALVQDLLAVLFPVVVGSDIVSADLELSSRESALRFDGDEVVIRPLSGAPPLLRTSENENGSTSINGRGPSLRRGSSFVMVPSAPTQHRASSSRLHHELHSSPVGHFPQMNDGNAVVQSLLEVVVAVFTDQILARKDFTGLGLFLKTPPGFLEHQTYFESWILRNTLSQLNNTILLDQKILWQPKVLSNLARLFSHVGEALYEGWFIGGADPSLDFSGSVLEYLQRSDISQIKSVRLCSQAIGVIRTSMFRTVILSLSQIQDDESLPFLAKLGYWQTVLLSVEETHSEYLQLICYLLYASLISTQETVRMSAANLWRIILVQRPNDASAILKQARSSEHRSLTSGFEKVLELDNETFLYWVGSHRDDLDSLFFSTLAGSWDKFVAEENSKTAETAKQRAGKRREKLMQWTRAEASNEDVIRRHEVTFDHWTTNIYTSEQLKHQRTVQDQQDNIFFTLARFEQMKRAVEVPVGFKPVPKVPKWRLDQTEGRNRMRLRITADVEEIEEAHQPKRKSSTRHSLKLDTSVPPSQNTEAVGLTPGSAVPASVSSQAGDATSSEAFPELQVTDNANHRIEKTDLEESFELVDDPKDDLDGYEDKNRKVMRSLHRGDQVQNVSNISRIIGLEAAEGLLILGKDHLYLLDHFFQRADGEIVDVWQASHEERDSYVRMISGREAVERRPASGLDEHETRSWKWADVISVSKRRFLFRDVALELFFADGRSYLLTAMTPMARNDLHALIIAKAPQLGGESTAKRSEDTWRFETLRSPDDEPQSFGSRVATVFGQGVANPATRRWIKGEISNFHYLMLINTMAGRTFNDLTQYPVFPWVLADYSRDELDLGDPRTFRDLSKPMGCQTPEREREYRDRYVTFAEMGDHNTPAFHYGTHYSSAMIVTSYLIRLQPFIQSYLLLQGGSFDHADRMFYSIEKAWQSASRINMADVRELTPEFFYLPEFLVNVNNYGFGTRQDSNRSISSVELPPWAKDDPKIFIAKHREALESPHVSRNLHKWIDLVFGCKQKGEAAVEAVNVFHHLSYQGGKDLDSITDPVERLATIGIIHNFGQTPYQVFQKAHPAREELRHPYQRLDTAAESLTQLPFQLLHSEERIASLSYSWKQDRLLCSAAFRLNIPPTFEKYMEWGFADGSLRFHAADSRKLLGHFEHLHIGQLSAALFADSRTLVTAGADCTLSVWNLIANGKNADLQPRSSLFGHRASVHVLAVSRSFSALLSASTDGTVILWDLNRLEFVRVLVKNRRVEHARINDVSGNIVICQGNQIALYTLNGELILEQVTGSVDEGPILCCAFYEGAGNEWLEREILFTGHRDGVVKVWSKIIRGGRFELELIRHLNHVDRRREDGRNVAAGISCILPMPQVVYTGDEAGKVDFERKASVKPGNLDFEARVPVPISVFPSTYRSDASAETTSETTTVEGVVRPPQPTRVGREDTREDTQTEFQAEFRQGHPRRRGQEEHDLHVDEDKHHASRVEYSRESYDRRDNNHPEVELTRERYERPAEDVRIDAEYERRRTRDQAFESQLDDTEREYRRRTDPNYEFQYTRSAPREDVEIHREHSRSAPREDVEIHREDIRTSDRTPQNDMGYYDDEGHYHSFRRGVERAADRVFHPFHHDHHDHHHHHRDHHDREEVVIKTDEAGPTRVSEGVRESVRYVEPRGGAQPNTIPIPCHFVRVGDLVILQGRTCQVIRISSSAQTGQFRYLGVDLFTRQLREESSFVSNPGNSVIVHSMLGPVYRQYRILDIREDGRLVCMTESGDVKQGLAVVDQGGLFHKIDRAFCDGRGSVRALVVNDGGRELVVDYKVIHGSRL